MSFVFTNFAQGTLLEGVNSSATVLKISVSDATTFASPSGVNVQRVVLSAGDGKYELVDIGQKSADGLLTVSRGAEGSTAQSWPAGTRVRSVFTGEMFSQTATTVPEIEAIRTLCEEAAVAAAGSATQASNFANTAQTQATASAGSAVTAGSHSASAESFSNLSAAYTQYGRSSTTRNPTFTYYLDAQTMPEKWKDSASGAGTRVTGLVGAFGHRLIGGAGTSAVLTQLAVPAAPGKLFVEATVVLQSGTWAGAGIRVVAKNASGSVLQTTEQPFSTLIDTSGTVSATKTGTRFFRLPSITLPDGTAQLDVSACSHDAAFGSIAAANSIDWHQLDAQPPDWTKVEIDNKASITRVDEVEADAASALASATATLTAAYQAADTSLQTQITARATITRVDAVEAAAAASLASSVATLTAGYLAGDSSLQTQVTARATNTRVDTVEANANSSIASTKTELQTYAASAGNLITNAEFDGYPYGWIQSLHDGGGQGSISRGINLPDWHGKRNVLYGQRAATQTTDGYFEIAAQGAYYIGDATSRERNRRFFGVRVTPGQRAYAAALVAAHGASYGLEVVLRFETESGGAVAEYASAKLGLGYGGANGDPANFVKASVIADVPSNAYWMGFMLRCQTKAGAGPQTFFATEPQMGFLAPGQTTIPAYTPGRGISQANAAFLMDAVSTGSTSAARAFLSVNTANNEASIELIASEGDGVWNGGVIKISGNVLIDGSVAAHHLAAASVTTAKLAAGAVTADKISVTELSAIVANLGTITGGTLRLTAGDYALQLGAGFGASSDLVLWFGGQVIGAASATKENCLFCFGTDGGVYYGGSQLGASVKLAIGAGISIIGAGPHSGTISATATGGSGSYIYRWSLEPYASGTIPTLSNITTDTVTIAASLSIGADAAGRVRCDVTDSAGSTATRTQAYNLSRTE